MSLEGSALTTAMPSSTLAGKTLFISGGSRGIGLAIALRAARDGANVVIAAKTDAPHPKLPGTVHSAAAEIDAAGGRGLGVVCDIRAEDQVQGAIDRAVAAFGGIDVVVNNASAISLTPTADTPIKRYDLMQGVNARGTFLCTQLALPHLRRAANPHVLTLSPPLDMRPRWFAGHVAYTIAKYGMSMCTLGMAEEFRAEGIAVNSLWPLTAIDTAAVRNVLGGDRMARMSRTPEIVADAAHAILTRSARECTGNFFIDEDVLRAAGVTDFGPYAPHAEGGPLVADFFVPDAAFARSATRVVHAMGGARDGR